MTELQERLAKARSEVNALKNTATRALYALDKAIDIAGDEPSPGTPVTPPVTTPPVTTPPVVAPPAPTVSLIDASIDGAAKEVHVTVELSGPVRNTVYVPVRTVNSDDPDVAKRMVSGFGYTPHSETLIFRPGDEPKRTFTLKLTGSSKPGQWFRVETSGEVPGAQVSKSSARVTIVAGAKTEAIIGARAPAYVPTKKAVTFAPDLSKIEASDSGEKNGKRVWYDRLRHGRTQDGNGELGYYAPGHWRTSSEGLILPSKKLPTRREETINGQTRLFEYDASVLMTHGLFEQKYGYWEADVKTSSARGSWGAFWLLPSEGEWWPPEIDILEHPRNHQFAPGDTTATHHWGTPKSVKRIGIQISFDKLFKPGFDATTDFHKYAVDWREDFTTWFIDGIEIFRAPTEFHYPAYLILNTAVGGWGGPPDFSKGTTDMIVREVKVYA